MGFVYVKCYSKPKNLLLSKTNDYVTKKPVVRLTLRLVTAACITKFNCYTIKLNKILLQRLISKVGYFLITPNFYLLIFSLAIKSILVFIKINVLLDYINFNAKGSLI